MDPLLAGAAAAGGALWSNQQNLAESKRARQWSAEMAGSAYQRAVIDLKAAGLNPALAYMQGGANTPGAATASVDNAVSPGVSSALSAKRLAEEIGLMRDQRGKIYGENALIQQNIEESAARTAESSARTAFQNVATELERLRVPQATNAARMERTRFGEYMPYVERAIGLLPRLGLRRN